LIKLVLQLVLAGVVQEGEARVISGQQVQAALAHCSNGMVMLTKYFCKR